MPMPMKDLLVLIIQQDKGKDVPTNRGDLKEKQQDQQWVQDVFPPETSHKDCKTKKTFCSLTNQQIVTTKALLMSRAEPHFGQAHRHLKEVWRGPTPWDSA